VASGWVAEPGRWWWELRPHVLHGTLEVRVPDVQPTVRAAEAVVSVVHSLVSRLAARHADGEVLGSPPTWRIAENRWSALRDGTGGQLADLNSGAPVATQTRLHQLLDDVEPHAPGGLEAARELVERNTAVALRSAGLDGAVPWLVEAFGP
jgi:carboxylate-amine ligase